MVDGWTLIKASVSSCNLSDGNFRAAEGHLPSWLLSQESPETRGLKDFLLFRGGGQGRDRTADLPLFRRNNHTAHGFYAEVDGGGCALVAVHGG
jgi:hypothetical protein